MAWVCLTLFRMGLLGAAHGWGQKGSLPKTCDTYATMTKLGTVIPYLQKIEKIYKSCDTTSEFFWYQLLFTWNQLFFISGNIDKNLSLKHNFHLIWFYFWLFGVLNMITVLMMSAKFAIPGLLKINLFWNKDYGAIISGHGVVNKILLCDSNVDIWPKFGNASISSLVSQFFKDLTKFNKLGEALVMVLKFYSIVAKVLRLKVRKFWGLILTFGESAGEKPVVRVSLLPE